MLGTLLTTVGLILSSRVQSVWQLFITFSLITGFGVSMVFSNTVAFIGISCDEHVSIANGVVTAGTAVALITFPFLINVLRSMYGWRGSLLLLGACVLHASLISLVIFKDPKTMKEDQKFIEVRADDDDDDDKKKEIIEEEKGTKELFKEYLKLPLTYPLFGFMLIIANLFYLSFIGTAYHLVSHAVDIGISEHNAALLMTIFGIGNLVSRLFNGVPIKFNFITSSKLFALTLLTASLCTFLIPFCTRYASLAGSILIIGWSVGGSLPLIYLISREIVGVRNFPKAMGVLLFSTAPSGVVGGFFTGWIYDVSGSYNTAFFAMGSLFFVAFLFQVLPRFYYLKYKLILIAMEQRSVAENMKETEERKASLLRTVVLVIGAHIVLILTDGLTLCFGVYLNDLADELNAGLGVLGAASSLLATNINLFGPIGTLIVLKIGYRRTIMLGTLLTSGGLILSSRVQSVWQLFISHSFVTGFGVSVAYTNTVAYIGISCDENISIANGVVTAGTAVGLIAFPFLINVLRPMYGWRGSLLLLGACVLHATLIGVVIFKDPKTTERKTICLEDEKFIEVRADDDDKKAIMEEEKGSKELLKEYLKLPLTYPLFGFLLIVANFFFVSFIGTAYHLVSHAVDIGISEHNAALLMTIFGIGNLVSRLFNGVPIKFNLITSSKLLSLTLLTASVCTFLIPFCTRYVYLVLTILLIGWSVGSLPLIYLISREIVGVRNFPKAMGVLLFSTAPSCVLGGFFTGWIYDVSGSYNTAFFAMGSLFFVAFLFQVLPRIYSKYKIRDIYTAADAATSATETVI
ncbi:monocarboxylate transporter 14-like [Antedon mediterranea]|uniref:monocarboxylate transporter 14-like n=1 Tax=Antedon mediterranea TaxID=105859 RepID=UPI003AF5D37D